MNMNFFRVIKDFYTGGNAFQGRMTRSDFWWWYLWYLLFAVPVGVLDAIVDEMRYGYIGDDLGIVFYIYAAVCFLPSISIHIQRIHDIGRTGWWVLVPIVCWIMALLPSDGPNQYDLDNNGPEDDKSTRRTRRNRPPIKKRHNTTRGSGNIHKYPEGKKNY